MEFYCSITKAIIDNALSFAKQNKEILDKALWIIKHCRKLLLYLDNEAWKKKNSDNCFDVAMGSYDGLEVCQLVGTLILSTFANSILKRNSGLCRDDSLILMRNENWQKTDRIRKEVITIFKEIDFKIEIKTNLKVVDFLDITFNLFSGIYKPYRKPNDTLLYVNISSNHLPQIIKQLPISTAKTSQKFIKYRNL